MATEPNPMNRDAFARWLEENPHRPVHPIANTVNTSPFRLSEEIDKLYQMVHPEAYQKTVEVMIESTKPKIGKAVTERWIIQNGWRHDDPAFPREEYLLFDRDRLESYELDYHLKHTPKIRCLVLCRKPPFRFYMRTATARLNPSKGELVF